MQNIENIHEVREQVLTLLLIERDLVIERLNQCGHTDKKDPASKRGKRSKLPSTVDRSYSSREAASSRP